MLGLSLKATNDSEDFHICTLLLFEVVYKLKINSGKSKMVLMREVENMGWIRLKCTGPDPFSYEIFIKYS